MLGQIGEFVTQIGLPVLGFTEIFDLNDPTADLSALPSHLKAIKTCRNHRDGDFLVRRGDQWFFLSSKARNWFTSDGGENNRHRLQTKRSMAKLLRTAEQYGAQFAFVSVRMKADTYTSYFGTYADLLRIQDTYGLVPNAVHLAEKYITFYEPIAINEKHTVPYELFGNRD